MESVVVYPVDDVAVIRKFAVVVPVGRVPERVLYCESKFAQEGIEGLPDKVAEYVTGKHGVVVKALKVTEKSIPS